MKIYRWEETDTQHIAVLRPDELFDLSKKEQEIAGFHEYDILARHILHDEMLIYATAFDKGCNFSLTKSMMERAPDIYRKFDEEELAIMENLHRKTA